MCLILFAYQTVPKVELVLLANRDEFYNRPTLPAHFWDSPTSLLAGKDLVSGGTWLGIDPKGRMAAITNFRQGMPSDDKPRSRGDLPVEFLAGNLTAEDYIAQCRLNRQEYGGFNLLLFDDTGLWHYCSTLDQHQSISPGIHGLSNHSLDTPWPKICKGMQSLESHLLQTGLEPEPLFALMQDGATAAPENLPDTDVGLEWETTLSPLFISSERYGTRSTTLLVIRENGQVEFNEINYPSKPETENTTSENKQFVFRTN